MYCTTSYSHGLRWHVCQSARSEEAELFSSASRTHLLRHYLITLLVSLYNLCAESEVRCKVFIEL